MGLIDDAPDSKAAPIEHNSQWADPLTNKPAGPPPSAMPPTPVLPIPLFDQILVQTDEAAQIAGSILLPDTSASAPLSGTVLAVGEGPLVNGLIYAEAMRLRVGDIVYYPKFAGEDVTVAGRPCKMMSQFDCKSRMPREGEPGHEEYFAERNRIAERNREARNQKDMRGVNDRLSQLGLKS
jgi:co-chaperonin GroES (HSP10)